MYSEAVLKVLNECKTWYLGTCGDEPNVAPMGMKAVLEDGTLAIANNFMKTTLKNIQANGKAVVVATSPSSPECYQVNGTATYVTEGPVVEKFKAIAEEIFKGSVHSQGAVLIKPEKIVVKTPGPDNGKTIEF